MYFLVTRMLSSHVCEIQLTPRSSPVVVHKDRLKKYVGPLQVRNWSINNDKGPQPPHLPTTAFGFCTNICVLFSLADEWCFSHTRLGGAARGVGSPGKRQLLVRHRTVRTWASMSICVCRGLRSIMPTPCFMFALSGEWMQKADQTRQPSACRGRTSTLGRCSVGLWCSNSHCASRV